MLGIIHNDKVGNKARETIQIIYGNIRRKGRDSIEQWPKNQNDRTTIKVFTVRDVEAFEPTKLV